MFDHGLEFALLFPERRHLEPAQQKVVVEQIKNYRDLLHEAMRELANEGKLRDLDTDIAARHLMQTIAGTARWYTRDCGISIDLLVEQTVNFNLSAILSY